MFEWLSEIQGFPKAYPAETCFSSAVRHIRAYIVKSSPVDRRSVFITFGGIEIGFAS